LIPTTVFLHKCARLQPEKCSLTYRFPRISQCHQPSSGDVSAGIAVFPSGSSAVTETLPAGSGLANLGFASGGVYARRRVVCGRRPNRRAVHLGEYLPVWKRVFRPDGQATDPFERESGWAVGWVASKSGSRISRADKYGRERIPGRPPGRHSGGPGRSRHGFEPRT
jgi:hypothetical protein